MGSKNKHVLDVNTEIKIYQRERKPKPQSDTKKIQWQGNSVLP
jgi:hypothetical protein